MEPYNIFKRENADAQEVYDVKGCEKVISVRGDTPFTLDIEVFSLADPYMRPINITTITNSQDFCISTNWPCIACGDRIVFKLSGIPIGTLPRVFTEIKYETCVPEKCCNC